jgi:YegS/Rv2252/BmrU family lipid kinase
MSPKIEAIINAGSGSVESEETKQRLEEAFAANNLEVTIHLAKGGIDIVELAKKAAEGDAEIICAGGGDGTMSAVASEIFKTDKTLGILPLGTLNNFSKDLKIPQNIEEAVKIIAENHTQNIDVGEVNGRIFLNNSSIGLYPHIVKRREKRQRLGFGKWRAALWASIKMLRRSPFFAVRLKTDEGERIAKTPFVFVGNNEYDMNFLNVGRRNSLTDGNLSVYFLHRSGRKGLFMLVLRTIFGRLKQTSDFEEINIEEIKIETRKKKMLVAFDGEVEMMRTPLCYCIHAKKLRVIVPKANDEEAVQEL